MLMSGDAEAPPDPNAIRTVAKVRRLMVIASLTTFIAIAAVFAVIGYRLFRGEERMPAAPDFPAALPAGSKVLSSAIGDGRLVLTVEVNGAVELLSFDIKTLRLLARVRLVPQ